MGNLRIGRFSGPTGLYQRDLSTVHPTDNQFPDPTFDLNGPFAGFPSDTVIINGVPQVGQGQILPPGVVPPKEWQYPGMVYSPNGNYLITPNDPKYSLSPEYRREQQRITKKSGY